MKLTVMKLVCLVVLLCGIFILCLLYDVEEANQALRYILRQWPKQADGSRDLYLPGMIAGIVMCVVGGYGFLPRLCRRKAKTVTYAGSQGEIKVELKPARKMLLKVMRKMPEIYSIKVALKPDKEGKRIGIQADVVLRNSAALGANQCAKRVADYLTTAAKEVLAIEEVNSVRVNIKGVHGSASKTGRQLREHVVRKEEEEAIAYALTPAALNAVSPGEDSTDNRPTGGAAAGKESEEAIGLQEDMNATGKATQEGAAASSGLNANLRGGGDDFEITLPPLLDPDDSLTDASQKPGTAEGLSAWDTEPLDAPGEKNADPQNPDAGKEPDIKWD